MIDGIHFSSALDVHTYIERIKYRLELLCCSEDMHSPLRIKERLSTNTWKVLREKLKSQQAVFQSTCTPVLWKHPSVILYKGTVERHLKLTTNRCCRYNLIICKFDWIAVKKKLTAYIATLLSTTTPRAYWFYGRNTSPTCCDTRGWWTRNPNLRWWNRHFNPDYEEEWIAIACLKITKRREPMAYRSSYLNTAAKNWQMQAPAYLQNMVGRKYAWRLKPKPNQSIKKNIKSYINCIWTIPEAQYFAEDLWSFERWSVRVLWRHWHNSANKTTAG